MNKINWKVRFKNKSFWLVMIPTVLLLVQQVAIIFGYHINFGDLGNQLRDIVNTVFFILAVLGVINDPTTADFSDSENAMNYEVPKED